MEALMATKSLLSLHNATADSEVPVSALDRRAAKRMAVRRKISPEAGRTLEILGHAIEYLADEYSLTLSQTGVLDSNDPRVEAIQILVSANRQVYYAEPAVKPRLMRFAAWLLSASPVRAPRHTSL